MAKINLVTLGKNHFEGSIKFTMVRTSLVFGVNVVIPSCKRRYGYLL